MSDPVEQNRHLSDDEICRWLCGEHDSDVRDHLAACEQCRREVGGTSETFGGFGAMAREESAARITGYRAPAVASVRARSWGWWPAGIGVVAAAALAVVLMLGGHETGRGPVQVAKMTAKADDDAALLKRVDADLARTAPGPMEPLANLITEGQ